MKLNQLKLNELKQLAKVWNVQPKGDKRYKKTWVTALEAKRQEIAGTQQEETKPSELTALQALESLKETQDNYIPLYEYRALLRHMSRQQQDAELYALEKQGVIWLSSLVEGFRYTPEQIKQGIDQGELLCPLFFAVLN